jgi:hypothetical protein
MKIDEFKGKVAKPDKTTPVVFNFRPNKFKEVAPEEFKAWEKAFAQYVGFPAPGKAAIKKAYEWSGDPRESISGSNDGWDDSDYLPR